MKTCKGCKQKKDMDEFYKHPQMADGLLNFCKCCVKTRAILNRKRNLERYRLYDRERSKLPHRRQANLERSRSSRRHDPILYRAHNKVNNAIRDNKIEKAEYCQV